MVMVARQVTFEEEAVGENDLNLTIGVTRTMPFISGKKSFTSWENVLTKFLVYEHN